MASTLTVAHRNSYQNHLTAYAMQHTVIFMRMLHCNLSICLPNHSTIRPSSSNPKLIRQIFLVPSFVSNRILHYFTPRNPKAIMTSPKMIYSMFSFIPFRSGHLQYTYISLRSPIHSHRIHLAQHIFEWQVESKIYK